MPQRHPQKLQTFSNINDTQTDENDNNNIEYNAHQFHINPIAHLTFSLSNICSKHHQVVQVYDYEDCSYTLHDELVSRNDNRDSHGDIIKKNFNCKEIWSIICSCVLPMAHFTRQNISHSTLTPRDIVLSNDGRIRVLGSEISEYQEWVPQHEADLLLGNIHTLHTIQQSPFFYYAPETLKILNKSSKRSLKNTYVWNDSNLNSNNKPGVFTLGLTILSVILCEEDLSYLYKIH